MLNGALHDADLVDEWLIYLAPCLLGSGRGIAGLAPLTRLSDATRLQFTDVARIGADVRVLARPVGRTDMWLDQS